MLKADHHSFYRNLLCVRKCIACTQAYISKYNSFSFPSPASFAEPPICAVHLQTCKRDRFPPASHHPAPLRAAGSNYQPCLTHNASVMMAQRFDSFSQNLGTLLTCLSWPLTTAPITTYHPARCSSFCIRSFASSSLQSHRTLLFPIPHHVGARWVLLFTKMI